MPFFYWFKDEPERPKGRSEKPSQYRQKRVPYVCLKLLFNHNGSSNFLQHRIFSLFLIFLSLFSKSIQKPWYSVIIICPTVRTNLKFQASFLQKWELNSNLARDTSSEGSVLDSQRLIRFNAVFGLDFFCLLQLSIATFYRLPLK